MNGFVVSSDGVVQDYDEWADTEFGPQFQQQAWSDGDPSVEPHPDTERHPWAIAARGAGLALGVGVAIAGAVLALTGSHAATTTATPDANGMTTVTIAPPPWTSPTEKAADPAPPPPTTLPSVPDAITITHDGEYFQTLRGHGFTIANPAQALQGAQIVCSNLAVAAHRPAWEPESRSPRSFVAWWMLNYDTSVPPGWTLADTRFLVDSDARFYCPGY